MRLIQGLLAVLLLIALLPLSHAVDVDPLPPGPLGLQARSLVETGPVLDLAGAEEALRQGRFQPGRRQVLADGLGARSVWQQLELNNPRSQTLSLRLVAGMTWVDHVDVYLRRPDGSLLSWHTGDELPGAEHAVPGLGQVFELALPPGRSQLFVRAETPDPMLVPLQLLSERDQMRMERIQNYGYGLLYGFLFALMAYNAVLYVGLRARSHLYYSLYLLSFICVNLSYTGHGHAWIWPEQPGFQRYVILSLMVVFGVCGLLFANRFLDTRAEAPRVWRAMRGLQWVGLLGMVLLAAVDAHEPAVWFSFGFLACVTVIVVALGLWSCRRRQSAAGYFLAAALCGMGGTLATILSVWGGLPMNELSFHAIDLGLMVEATLFALALAARMRYQERARESAERLARIDPLTGLLNRRAFDEQAQGPFSTAERSSRPLCVLMLDVDHFKAINDGHGHDAGDAVLVAVGELLRQSCRAGDLLTRWGGEEFLLLLPETGVEQGLLLAERIRSSVAARPIRHQAHELAVSLSLGVAGLKPAQSLASLIQDADGALYRAKAEGRNRSCVA
ncbi:diguanylate cyclase [Pelomonas sp. SE-A7]|uniref:sensor domain-containing diguanylate cyclase n=1 Tax=Pelomonas sp. SE-A7 TaxID=3054953 RepID=UPI00259CECE4|nr:diguanylate cyclase [Pelomonas sp. SE-A7]MDM4764953.1 diguanylate cyclase [Pelomonas sp. SE-A7]